MLPAEFEPGMKKLVTIFHPKNWDDDTNDAYYGCVRRWTPDEWDDVVEEAVRTMDWMPKPKRLLMMKLDLLGRDEAAIESGPVDDCNCCFDGLIQFIFDKNGIEYERVCACTCDAGKKQLMKSYGGSRIKSYLEIFNEPPAPVKDITDSLNQPEHQNENSKEGILAEAAEIDGGLPSEEDLLLEDGLPF